MTATPLGSNTFTFADGNAGHVCDLGSAPTAGVWDVLCVNSNTVVDTPSGFSLAPTSVGGQGAYIFRREAVGGEGSTITITTSGDHNTQVSWSRWGNVNAADDASRTAVDGVSGSSSPAHTTNALAEADELVIAFAALHQTGGTPATSPVWGTGYTGLTAATQGSGGSGVVGFVGYRLDGGPSAESPSVSWTNAASDRYMLVLTFTTVEAAATATLDLTATAATMTADASAHSDATLAATAAPATLAINATEASTAALSATAAPATMTANASASSTGQLDLAAAPATFTAHGGPPVGGDLDVALAAPRSGWSLRAPRTSWSLGQPRA